jgi:hypothetical protein
VGDLTKPVELVEAVVADLDELLSTWTVDDLEDALDARSILSTTSMGLAQIRERLDDLIGDAMGTYRLIVEGRGMVERHKKKSRTKWDREELLRHVLDTRVFDPDTGEDLHPTPLDKVLHVWNLGAPRITALKERGLDADEFAEVEERKGWTLKIG